MGGITPRASSSDAFTMYYAWGGLGTLPTGFFRDYGNIPNDSGIDVTASSGIYELTFTGGLADLLPDLFDWVLFVSPVEASTPAGPVSYCTLDPTGSANYAIQCWVNGVAALFALEFFFLATPGPGGL